MPEAERHHAWSFQLGALTRERLAGKLHPRRPLEPAYRATLAPEARLARHPGAPAHA